MKTFLIIVCIGAGLAIIAPNASGLGVAILGGLLGLALNWDKITKPTSRVAS